MDVPVVVSFVDDHRQHLRHGVIGTLDAPVTAGVVGAVETFCMPRCLYTASDSLEQRYSPLSEGSLVGRPPRGMYLLPRKLVLPSTVNSTEETAYMSARGLNLSVKRRMRDFPQGVIRRGLMSSILTATPGSGREGKGRDRMGQRTIYLKDVCARHCRQRRSHHLVQMLMPIHQPKLSSIESV